MGFSGLGKMLLLTAFLSVVAEGQVLSATLAFQVKKLVSCSLGGYDGYRPSFSNTPNSGYTQPQFNAPRDYSNYQRVSYQWGGKYLSEALWAVSDSFLSGRQTASV